MTVDNYYRLYDIYSLFTFYPYRYSVQSLLPLGQYFEAENSTVQTQTTGEVTLTSNLNNHNRTIGITHKHLNKPNCNIWARKYADSEDISITPRWHFFFKGG